MAQSRTEDYTVESSGAEESEDARLSRLLFEARTAVEFFAAPTRSRADGKDKWSRRLIAEIDAYRNARGWSPDGFGGE